MEDDETFDEFNSKLNAIVNDTFTLGEPVPENIIVKKILRSLPKSFNAKVVAIEENKILITLKVNELIGNLQTFEANIMSHGKTQSKGMALKASKGLYKKVASDLDSDSEEIDPQVAVEFMKQFKLFMKGQKTNVRIPKNSGKNKSFKGIECYECQGYGQIVNDCGNKKSKKKALNTTWEDETSYENDETPKSDKPDIGKGKFIAFMETFGSATSHVSSEPETDQDTELDEEPDWKAEYETLFKKTMKMVKVNEKVAINWKVSEEKNSSLKAELAEALAKVQKLEDENDKLADKLIVESQKCDILDFDMKTLKAENSELNGRLKMVLSELNTAKASLNRMNTGSKTLDDILCSQKTHTDKHGIGYADEASTSNAKGKNYFAKTSVVTNPVVSVAKQTS
ncbi:hypothetical protein AAC387_Pa12g1686 [Persea americana]